MEKLRNSFKSSPTQQQKGEEHEILLYRKPTAATTSMPSSSFAPSPPAGAMLKKPFVANGDTSSKGLWRNTSCDLSTDDAVMRAAANSKDFDFVSDSPSFNLPQSSYSQSPQEVRVSFPEITEPATSSRSNVEPDEVLVCSSNHPFRRKSSLMRTKTKSRLLHPSKDINPKSKTQKLSKSQILGTETEEDDPFLEHDLPDHYKKTRFSATSVVELVSLILIFAALICSLTIKVLKRRNIAGLELWKWELMVLVLISVRLVSGWGIRVVVFFIERNFMLRKQVLYFVYGLRNAVQNCIWLALVLIAWHLFFDKNVKRVADGQILSYVTKIWVWLLVGTLIWLLKTLLVKVLASSFHVSTFFDRIQEALFSQYVIENLSGLPLVEIQLEQEDEEQIIIEVEKFQSVGVNVPEELKANIFSKSGRTTGGTPKQTVGGKSRIFFNRSSKKDDPNGITIDHLHRLNQKNISAWNMKMLINIVRQGVLSTTLDEKLHGSMGEDEETVLITTENQAVLAAKKIFDNVAKPEAKHIYEDDLRRFMREDEVSKTIHLFESGNEEKGISKRALKDWVVNAIKERRALALSLNDTKTAVNTLHHMLNAVVGILIFVMGLVILKVATTHFFILLSSQLLLVVFVFGNTCKTTFEAIIFLFVMHPFDVGDRVEVDGVQLVVEEMNILTTIFLKYDNHKLYYPNSVLATKPIYNYYRSPEMGDTIDFSIHVSTPAEKITVMKERITSYVDSRSEHWHPTPIIVMKDVEDMNRLKWSIWLTQRINFQEMGERWTRRALLLEEMVKIFRELDIEYRLLPRDVNVRDMPPISSTRVPSNWNACSAST